MANTNISNQFYITGQKSVDAKLQPVDDINGLKAISVKDRYVGMTVTVLNAIRDEDGYIIFSNPIDYWLVDGTSNKCWKVKSSNTTVPTYAALMALTVSEAYTGMERIVIADETNENKMTKYWVTGVDTERGVVDWSRKEYGENITIDGDDATASTTLKGFKVVTLETYLAAVEAGTTDGYLWFVRDFSGDTVISSAIYFEERKYAETNNGGGGSDARVDNIIASLGRIVNANGQWSGFFPTHALLWNTNSVEEALVALETAIINNRAILDGKVDKEVYESAITAINEAIIADEEAINSLADELALKANKADVYTKSEIDAKIAGAFHFRGTASGLSEDKTVITGLDAGDGITASTENIGDVYQIGHQEFASNGNIWVELGMDIDLSPIYAKLAELESAIAAVSESVEELDEALSTQIEKVSVLEKIVGNTALPSADTITNIINNIITVTGDDF